MRETKNIPAKHDPIVVDVKTHDTDFIPISLSYFHTIAKENFQVRVFFNAKRNKKEDGEENDDKTVLLVHKLYEEIQALLGDILTRPDLSMVRNPRVLPFLLIPYKKGRSHDVKRK
jgi:hypothetical protein